MPEGELVRKQFYWFPPWVMPFLFGGPLIILVCFLACRKCSLTFRLDSRLRKKYRRRVLLKTVAMLTPLFAIPLLASLSVRTNVILASIVVVVEMILMVLFLVALLSLPMGNSPLSIVKYRKGMFWIKGFSDEFLASFKPRSST